MEITVELSSFAVSQRTSSRSSRKFVNSSAVGVRELHGEEIPGNVGGDLAFVRFDDASQNRRLRVLCKDLGTHANSTTLSSHISFDELDGRHIRSLESYKRRDPGRSRALFTIADAICLPSIPRPFRSAVTGPGSILSMPKKHAPSLLHRRRAELGLRHRTSEARA